MTKKEIRQYNHAKRMALNSEVIADLHQKIFNQFFSLKLPYFEKILSYSALLSKNEFDISPVNRYIHSIHPSAVFSLPRISENYKMDAVLIGNDPDHTDIRTVLNNYGIPEPAGGAIIEPLGLDLVFIPLLGFDKKGYRVGFGKGYYDRFLRRCRTDILKIGFSFFEAEQAIEDINNYDVPLNLCITPLNVYEF